MSNGLEKPARPAVGVGVIVLKPNGEVLVGRRRGPHGGGEWALPGGHLELGEELETCACREVEEETGIALDPAATRFAYAVNSIFNPTVHYVTVFMLATVPSSTQAHNLEPEKCDGWEWVPWGQIAESCQPLFLPLRKLLLETDFKLPTASLEGGEQ